MEAEQFRLLKDILHSNCETDYGYRYSFRYIKTFNAFQKMLPVTEYEDYRPLIDLATRIGEINIIAAEPTICYMAKQNGEELMLFPCTASHIKSYLREIKRYHTKGSIFLLEYPMQDRKIYKGGAGINTIEETIISAAGYHFRYNSHTKLRKSNTFTCPRELLHQNYSSALQHAHILFALLDRQVEYIYSHTISELLTAFKHLESNWEVFLSEIKEGALKKNEQYSDQYLDFVSNKIKSNPNRAKELYEVFSKGFSGVAKLIWPGLRNILLSETSSNEGDLYSLNEYIGEVPISQPFILTPVALLARQVTEDNYILLPDNCFYEFLPREKASEISFCLIDQIMVGSAYEIIVTNYSGLYRYRTGLNVVVRGFKGQNPIVSFEK